MAKIGIGITTHNRSGLLATALAHIIRHLPSEHQVKIVVVDDYSNDEHFDKLLDIAHECKSKVTFIFKAKRDGVAAAKNECLRRLVGADYIFLFDDDCYPIKDGWEKPYIESGIDHAMYMRNDLHEPQIWSSKNLYNVVSMKHCSGAMLFLTKRTLAIVGGMNREYKLYGFEHMGYSQRVYRAGLTGNNGPYLSILEAEPYFRSLDFELGSCGGSKISSISDDERHEYYHHNMTVFLKECSNGPIYQEFK
jgi:glycosyltransferase involved in cell wall biosynthesis